ncbi:hypothetical protein CLV98_1533 [Dyadobacter jejuensis]|uniref:Tail tube protein n=1 Tax=Dyadobacter jejuensis TaxID=1082580 RepID=A0A315ZSE0_9BACT|nr:hypothetical protein [Dyadobacter jejuensis]PWJ48481.1 hypothetical protein CLV98_1533 [Dyadobacter jejuensis]
MASKFSSLQRQARGKINLGGMARMVLLAESDFTAGWPIDADIVDGECTEAPRLAEGVIAAELTFDNHSGRAKSTKKGAIGYQNVEHEVDCKFAGCSKEQLAAVLKFLNEGGVIIAFYKDGTRRVYGASWNPLVIEDSDDSGAKADDPKSITFKGKADGFGWHAPFLAESVTLATDTAAVKPMPFAIAP